MSANDSESKYPLTTEFIYNPYLIPPVYVKPLVNKLGLHNDYELFWGDINDETFIEEVFCNLLTDILDEWEWNESYLEEPYWSESSEKVNIIEKVLLDDVPYAKIHSKVMSAYAFYSNRRKDKQDCTRAGRGRGCNYEPI